MERNPIYLLIGPSLLQNQRVPEHVYTDCILQMRINLDPLESYRFDRHADGLVLKIPSPIIEIAKGRRDDLFGLANKLFGARHGAWSYVEDNVWSYQIQAETDLPPPLTEREKFIIKLLEEAPRTFDEIFSAFPAETEVSLRSALRFLYESGYVIQDETNYTVRHR